MNKALRVADYLGHILEAIERIEEYVANMDERAFLASKLVQDAVIHNIEVIGEALKKSNVWTRSLPRGTTTFRGRSCMRCVIAFHMATTRWTLKWSGRRYTTISLPCAA